MVGYDCSLTANGLQHLDLIRQRLCETFLQVAELSNPSAALLENLVGSLSATFDPAQVISNASYTACSGALKVVVDMAFDGLLAEASPSTTTALIVMAGKFLKTANVSAGNDGSMFESAFANIAKGVLSSMVNGQADITVASDTVRFSATKTMTSAISALTPPPTAEEEAYGLPAKASLELLGHAGSACDAGSGYVDMSITQWGVNPYPGASQLGAPQIKLESRVPAAATERRKLLQTNTVPAVTGLSGIPSYFVTFLYNQPNNVSDRLHQSTEASNITFPACTTYDAATATYKSCDDCVVSTYTRTNVTFACYNVSTLCSADGAISADQRMLSAETQRMLAGDDYADDSAGFGSQTSVTSIQYSAVLDTLSDVLSANPSQINFQAAKVILSVVVSLFVVVFLGFVYFRAWDVRDHHYFLYKYKEPPHLRAKVKKNYRKRIMFPKRMYKMAKAYSMGPNARGLPTASTSPSRNKGSFSPANKVVIAPTHEDSLYDFDLDDDDLSVTYTPNQPSSPFFGFKRPMLNKMASLRFGDASDDVNVNEDELIKTVISDYIRTVIPIKNLNGQEVTLLHKLQAILSQHPVSTLLCAPSLQTTRVLRWARVCMNIMTALFIDTLFFSTFYPNAGVCESYYSETECITPQNHALGTSLCIWSSDPKVQYGGSCAPTPPPSDMMFVMILVMLTLVIAVPLTFLFDVVMMEYCAKRPDFARWGWNTEAILGRSTQSLGEFTKDKLLSPIVVLRKEVEASRQENNVSARFHSDEYQQSAHKSAADRALDDIQEEARGIYDEFTSVSMEAELLLNDVISYLTVSIRNQNAPWRTTVSPGLSAADALKLSAEKVRAIERYLGVYADGTPVPLSVMQWLQYGTPRAYLEAKIAETRAQEAQIVETLDGLGDSELLSKDQALTQFFILEQFSIFKQYALRTQLFAFDVTTAQLVHPTSWVLSWAFLMGTLLFFFYWALMWGVSTTDATIEAWGVNFAIATAQEMIFIQTFRLYVLYMISTITIKPQLTAIYTTLQRLAVEYVQDELPEAFGVIKVMQHLSPACRVANMKVADNLAAGQILRHIDDRDIENFRTASKLKLPMLFLGVVAIPVIIGLLNEAAGELMLDTVLPSAFSMMIVAHYFAWQVHPLVVIVPCAVIVLFMLCRRYLFNQAELRVKRMKEKLNNREAQRSLAGWHIRSGSALELQTNSAEALVAYVKSLYHLSWSTVADVAANFAYYLGRWREWRQLLLKQQAKRSADVKQWRTLNIPAQLHGGVLSSKQAALTEQRLITALAPPDVPQAVQRLSKDVRSQWGLANSEAQEYETTEGCTSVATSYLQCLLGVQDLSLLQPAILNPEDAAAEYGEIICLGWQTYSHARINSKPARDFKLKYGYCSTTKRALARVVALYREQMLSGSIYFLSLLDEQQLTSAHTPLSQLKYSGQVHVRDLALMLEEILYFYRPAEQQLSPAQLKRVLAEYDRFVAGHSVPMDPDVMLSVTAMMSVAIAVTLDDGAGSGAARSNNSAIGYFQQHKLVKTMHFDQIAKEVRSAREQVRFNLPPAVVSTNSADVIHVQSKINSINKRYQSVKNSKTNRHTQHFVVSNESVRWSDIRKVLDDAPEAPSSASGKALSAATQRASLLSKSVAARAAEKRLRQEKMRIAHAMVPFQQFARWIHSVLKRLAEEQAEESAFQREFNNQGILGDDSVGSSEC